MITEAFSIHIPHKFFAFPKRIEKAKPCEDHRFHTPLVLWERLHRFAHFVLSQSCVHYTVGPFLFWLCSFFFAFLECGFGLKMGPQIHSLFFSRLPTIFFSNAMNKNQLFDCVRGSHPLRRARGSRQFRVVSLFQSFSPHGAKRLNIPFFQSKGIGVESNGFSRIAKSSRYRLSRLQKQFYKLETLLSVFVQNAGVVK